MQFSKYQPLLDFSETQVIWDSFLKKIPSYGIYAFTLYSPGGKLGISAKLIYIDNGLNIATVTFRFSIVNALFGTQI